MKRSRTVRLVAPAAAAACALAAAVVPGQVSAAEETVMGAGRTVLVSAPASTATPGEDEAQENQAATPTISSDGSTVAYQATAVPEVYYEEAASWISVRDLASGRERRVAPGSEWSWAPSLDSDGKLLSFLTSHNLSYESEFEQTAGTDVDAYVQPLPTGRAERVTGRSTDLPYQRTLRCLPQGDPDGPHRCGPQLSDNGRMLAVPSALSLVSPKLHMSMWEDQSSLYLDDNGQALAAVDFGSSEEADDGGCDDDEGECDPTTLRTIRVSVWGRDSVTIGSVRVRGGQGTFEVTDGGDSETIDCAGATIGGGAGHYTCAVAVAAHWTDVCGTVQGRLLFGSPTPRGRTAVNLLGHGTDCGDGDSDGGVVNRSVGPPRCADTDEPPAYAGEPITGGQTVNFREVPLDQPRYRTIELTNIAYEFPAEVALSSRNCAVQLVAPSEPPAEGVICEDGVELAPRESCRALVRFAPQAVAPVAGSVALLIDGQPVDEYGEPTDQVIRFVGAGTRTVVVAWTDRDGDGIFVGRSAEDEPGRRPTVVSVDSAGRTVDGRMPSLSADGRHVAFASRVDDVRGTQVLVHDTQRRGKAGSTVMASRERPGPAGLHEAAMQPSLSGDGSRVAYTTRDELGDESVSYQVRVRDLAQRRTLLVSTPDGATEADDSWAPSLSKDGRALAFTSSSNLLAPDGVELGESGTAVYVRDLTAKLERPRVVPDIVSLDPLDGEAHRADQPAIDGDGGVTVFRSDGALLPEAPFRQDSIYARARFPVLTAEPDEVDLGVSPVGGAPVDGSSVDGEEGTQRVTVTNTGPGPGYVTTEVAEPFATDDGCSGLTLRRDESCTVILRFAPTDDGEVRTALTTIGTPTAPAFADGRSTATVTLVGVGVPALTTLRPARLTFPETGLGITSEPLPLRVTNVLDIPVQVDAAVSDGDAHFEVAAPAACDALAPGATCAMEVRFHPLALEERIGAVEVVSTAAGAELAQEVALSGPVSDPVLSFSPTVAREGRVTFIEGEHFVPGLPVALSWSTGPVAVPLVIPDEEGTFSAPVIVLSGGGTGPRDLTATMPIPILAILPSLLGLEPPLEEVAVETEVLVVPGSLQPPGFVTRN